ncbi:MAG: hypothetical protein INR68_18870 [Methylobacterium mesophilicum]|nr:hypothetical protein [Methylobacterium mesophilicum]
MAGDIKDFDHAVRLGLGIHIRCRCGKEVIHAAADFVGVVRAGAQLEDVRFRCSWCGGRPALVRYRALHGLAREDIAEWHSPTRHRKGRWTSNPGP